MENHNFACMNSNGMVIEKSQDFNHNNCGYLTDIIQKARNILPKKNFINNIEIFFDKSVILIQDNTSTDLNMTMIVENDK